MRTSALLSPERSAWLLALLIALGVSAGVYRIPIQVSDSLEVLEHVNNSSLGDTFVSALSSSRTMLRPLRQVQSKLLLKLAGPTGDGYTRAFRGFHAISVGLLFVLFVAVLRCRTWEEVAAAGLALTVVTGLHTTTGMLSEAYPVNHFLLIAIYMLLVLLLARSRGSVAADFGAVACFALASLTLESGLLVLPLAIAAYVSGERGISRRALAAMLILAVGYLYLRIGYLHMEGPTVGERPVGFGLSELDAEAIAARFPQPPLALYAYTSGSAILMVLFSEPINGTWAAVRSWLDGSLHAFDVIAVGTSTATTVLAGWYLWSRNTNGVRRFRETIPLMTLTLLVSSAALSYAYTKPEIMSAAGVFYALLTYQAARQLFERAPTWKPATRQVIVILMMATSCAWAVRAMGLQYRLERSAFSTRNDWVHDEGFSLEAHTTTALESSLRRQALRRVSTNPYLMPRALEDIWGGE